MSTPSDLERALLWQIKVDGLPEPAQEYRFAPPRRWRFDLAWPDQLLAVEVQGAVWRQGRHSRGAGQLADMDKSNAAVLLGWRVLHFGAQHIDNGTALETIKAASNWWEKVAKEIRH